MKKRFLAFMLSLAMVISMFPAAFAEEIITVDDSQAAVTVEADAATSGTCGDNVTWALNGSTLTISGTGAMTNYVSQNGAPWYSLKDSISAVVIEDGVTSIGQYAFYELSSMSKVTIADSVTSIGDMAFDYCSSLRSAEIPAGVTSIGERAFSGCSALKSVNIPDGITSISYGTFSDCSGLKSITIPNGVTSIGNDAFGGCRGLKSVEIPDSVVKIDIYAFEGCSGLKSVTIPDGVVTIGNYAFTDCIGLTSIDIPDSVVSLGRGAFGGCSGLKSVKISNSITSINSYAFSGCSALKSVTIPDGVTSIGGDAFQRCKSLKSIKIPDSVTSIDSGAFYGCSVLKSVDIPDSVTSIVGGAFQYCYALETIRFYGNAPTFGDSYVFYSVTATAYYPKGNDTWTESKRQNYGGTITWVEWDPNGSDDSGSTSTSSSNAEKIKTQYARFESAMDSYMKTIYSGVEAESKAASDPVEALKQEDQSQKQPALTCQATAPTEAVYAAYKGLSEFYDKMKNDNTKIQKIDVSGLSVTSINAQITKAIANSIKTYNFTTSTDKYTVKVNILVTQGVFTGSIYVTAKTGAHTQYTFIPCSNNKDVTKAMAEYLKFLADTVEDVSKEFLKNYMTEFRNVTCITELTEEEVKEIVGHIADAMQKKGYGKLLKDIVAIRKGYNHVKKITGLKDAQSVAEYLSDGNNATTLYDELKSLDYTDGQIKNELSKQAFKDVEKAREKLEDMLWNWTYHHDEEIETEVSGLQKMKDKFIGLFNCPVSITVYDEDNNVLGYATDGYCEYEDSIYIEVADDVKTVCVPQNMNIRFEITGTDDGTMTYALESASETESTGRVIYYDVPITKGKTYTQTITGDLVTNDLSARPLVSDDTSINADEYIGPDSEEYCNVTCTATEGGIVAGGGQYIKGNTVELVAYPDEGYEFFGWYDENDYLVETARRYRTAAENDFTLKAVFVAKPKATEITCEDSFKKTVGDKSFSLNATSNGDGQLYYTSDDESIATVSKDGVVTVNKAGTVELYIEAAGTDNYEYAIKTVTLVVKEADAHEHSCTEKITKEATCTEAGEKTLTCSCGETKNEEIPALGHKYDEGKVTTPPTCTEEGVKTYTCTRGDDSYTVPIDATGHTKVTVTGKAATCTEDGLTDGVQCSVCGETLTEQQTIKAAGHTYTSAVTKEPTATEDGVRTYTCSACGDTYNQPIPATGETHKHSYTEKVTKAATCTETGEKTFTCECGDKYIETIPATGHTEVSVGATPATCTQDGLTAGTKCSVCGAVIKAHETVKALGHDYRIEVTKEPTATEKGENTYTCKLCGNTYKTEIPATGSHTTGGQTVVHTHSYTAKVIREATCTVEGTTLYICSCGAMYTEDIPTVAHTEVATSAVAPTYTKTGLTAGTKCSVCGTVIKAQETVAKLTVAKVTGLKVKNIAKKKLRATWDAQNAADGYQLQYGRNKRFANRTSKLITSSATTKKIIKRFSGEKLKKGKTYYVKIRAYVIEDGVRIYSDWSEIKKVKVKK